LPLSQLREFVRHRPKLTQRPIDLSVPELPVLRSHIGIDIGHFGVLSVTLARDMIGDLLQRLDLHGDVKPVSDMRRRLRQRLRQPYLGARRGPNRARSRALLSTTRSPSFSVRWRKVTKDSVGLIGRNSAIASATSRYGKSQTRGALRQFRRRLIRADIAQDCPGITKIKADSAGSS
jgi:hypothetical protein